MIIIDVIPITPIIDGTLGFPIANIKLLIGIDTPNTIAEITKILAGDIADEKSFPNTRIKK